MSFIHLELTEKILKAAIEVHRELGPGLYEKVYEECLTHELIALGLEVKRQVPMTVEYKGVKVPCAFRSDLIVDDKVIVELKSVRELDEVHTSQVMTYLRVSGCRVGLLLNFNVKYLKYGIKRIIL